MSPIDVIERTRQYVRENFLYARPDVLLGEDEHLLENVNARGAQLRAGVEELPLVVGTSGAGLLIGIRLSAPVAAEVREAAHERGLIINAPTADVIRIAPAFTIGDAEVAEFLTLFRAALDTVASVHDTMETPA